jgi:methionine synthase II (cobalamin-independent)
VERRLFRDAMARLTDGVGDMGHLSLAITMGSGAHVGGASLFDLPFRSYLFDLIAGPDNWRLVSEVPAERGVICGVADARTTRPDEVEVMVWAAHYAASTQHRGLDRVGVAPSTGLEYLPRDRAKAKIESLGAAARHAAGASDEVVRSAPPPAAMARRQPAGVGEART